MNTFTIAGSVILYNPDDSVLENIKTYIDFLDCLFVVNNGGGEQFFAVLQKEYSNVHIIEENENMGIAHPLNQVLALCDGKYDFLMTMDQDSRYTPDSMAKYKGQVDTFDWSTTLGIAPSRIAPEQEIPDDEDVQWQKTIRVITSGNIIRVKNAIQIGGFNEDLFIDEVDYDFCYRGGEHKFDVYKCTSGIVLKHSVGHELAVTILGHTFKTMNHGPMRKYYIVRNRLYIFKRFSYLDRSWFFKHYLLNTIKYIVKVGLFEKQKYTKLRFCFKGIFDFLMHETGKYGSKHEKA